LKIFILEEKSLEKAKKLINFGKNEIILVG
jgi:hypothetical protein